MGWLVRGDRVLASLEIPNGRKRRAKGLIGRDSFEGAMMIIRCRSVHTVGMKFSIDVAFLDAENTVVDIVTVAPQRITRPRFASRSVIEARAGSFERWGVEVGQELEIRT